MNKETISKELFEKKVEMEAAYLMHNNNLSKEKADKAALEIIQERFDKE